MHIDHVNISAPMDLLEKVRDFYCEIFDLTSEFRPGFSTRGFWLYAQDKAIIHLAESQEHHRHEKQGYFDHFALQTTDLGNVLEKLNRTGIKYRTSHVADIGLTQVFFKDPSGTGVEVNSFNE